MNIPVFSLSCFSFDLDVSDVAWWVDVKTMIAALEIDTFTAVFEFSILDCVVLVFESFNSFLLWQDAENSY